jgi:hypothetical protein
MSKSKQDDTPNSELISLMELFLGNARASHARLFSHLIRENMDTLADSKIMYAYIETLEDFDALQSLVTKIERRLSQFDIGIAGTPTASSKPKTPTKGE